MGGRDLLRTQPPSDGFFRWVPYRHSHGLGSLQRASPMGALAERRRPRSRDCARRSWWIDRDFLAACLHLNGARHAGPDVLLHNDRARFGDVAGLEAWSAACEGAASLCEAAGPVRDDYGRSLRTTLVGR